MGRGVWKVVNGKRGIEGGKWEERMVGWKNEEGFGSW